MHGAAVWATIGELLRYGDFSLGTFNQLDGEKGLFMFEGVVGA